MECFSYKGGCCVLRIDAFKRRAGLCCKWLQGITGVMYLKQFYH